MCDFCLKHGANGKWYLNAQNYLKKEQEDYNHAVGYLEVLWGNLERIYLGKVYGMSINTTIDHRLRMPFLGRLIRWMINNKLEKEKNPDPRIAEGHFGQVIPVEEAKIITSELADVRLLAKCPCLYMHRGMAVESCMGFTVLAEVLPLLPRFIPENCIKKLTPEKAEAFLDEMNLSGRVNTIWTGPIPYIAALCSCEFPVCMGLRTRLDYNINTVLKAEYVAVVDPNSCIGCGKCGSRCQFGALSFSRTSSRSVIDVKRCFGCGLCKETCEEGAIRLVDRNSIPLTTGLY